MSKDKTEKDTYAAESRVALIPAILLSQGLTALAKGGLFEDLAAKNDPTVRARNHGDTRRLAKAHDSQQVTYISDLIRS